MSQDQARVQPAGLHATAGFSPSLFYSRSELLAMHEDLAIQFRREFAKTPAEADYFKSRIELHEKAAAALRAQIESVRANLV